MNSQLSLRKMKVNSKNKTRSTTQIHFSFTNKKENISNSKSLDQKSVNLILQIEMKTCFVYISFLFT